MINSLVIALYHFTPLPDYAALQAPIARAAREAGLKGTLLLASEGVNGTLAGAPSGVEAFLAALRRDPRLAAIEPRRSWAPTPPFKRLKVRLKREIVSMGAPGVVTAETVGAYVAPENWNAVISDPETAVIDVRNDYEAAIGTFAGAIDPKTESFRRFPDWARREAQPGGRLARARRVATFCTGGVRCEKATAFLRDLGLKTVLQLRGGVLGYLETVDPAQSLWRGHCFVFDERVSVGHGLQPGPHALCFGCRRPLSPEHLHAPSYRPGVCCPHCADTQSPEQRARFEERHRQLALAAARDAEAQKGGR